MKRQYWVYILGGRYLNLYVGMTNNITRRIQEHKAREGDAYTARYNITNLLYYESTPYVLNAIRREKELKRWPHEQKIALIKSMNTEMLDLAERFLPQGSQGAKPPELIQ